MFFLFTPPHDNLPFNDFWCSLGLPNMAHLLQSERNIIERYPLDNSLHYLHSALRDTEQCYDLPDDESRQKTQKSVSRLLLALIGQTAAFNLRSRSADRDLASELFGQVRIGIFDYQDFRALVQHVLREDSDFDIWSAVFDLISAVARVTPPRSIAPSFDGTPITHSSASFQGKEQTRKHLDDALFWEIMNCTYRGVEGFFEKYFEEKRWSRRSKGIYNTVKKRYVDGRWTDFPDPPTENDVWSWLSHLQDEVLTKSQNVMYRAKRTSDLTGTEPSRQMDIFFKRRSKPVDAKHDWKDVLVIGEHKKAGGHLKHDLVQLSGFVREVFAVQPTRLFIHCFFLFGTKMELWVFDRSGPYSSGEFDIHEEPEKFVRAITGYAIMSDKELGLDAFFRQKNGGLFVSVTDDTSGKKKRLQLEPKPFVKQRAVVCRGTNCYRTHDQASVVKFSWTSDKRKPEAELLRLARERGVKGIASLLGYRRITSIEEMRKGLTFTTPHQFRVTSSTSSFSSSQSASGDPRSLGAFRHFSIDEIVHGKRKSDDDPMAEPLKKARSNSQRSRLSQTCNVYPNHEALQSIGEKQVSLYDSNNGSFENRLFCCLVISPAGQALREFRSIQELLTVLRDAIKAHRSLHCDGEILHRDISENNIIITDPKQADGFVGMLIDLDLAKLLGSERSGARHQTGTREFMAIQVLQRLVHTYRHDMESLFYVLLWICARRSWEVEFRCKAADRPKESRLKKWYMGSYDDIADAKMAHMGVSSGFETVLSEFPPAFNIVKSLCRDLRDILFKPLEGGERNMGTPSDPPEKLYDAIIGAYDDAIDIAKAEDR